MTTAINLYYLLQLWWCLAFQILSISAVNIFWISIVSIQYPPLCHHIIFCHPFNSPNPTVRLILLSITFTYLCPDFQICLKCNSLRNRRKEPCLVIHIKAIWDPFLWLDHSCHCFELESQRSLTITTAVVLNEAFHSFAPPVLHCFCTLSLFMFFIATLDS